MMEISNHTLPESGWQGNTIPMAWSTFGSTSVSKSLGNQIDKCDLFLNFSWQVSK